MAINANTTDKRKFAFLPDIFAFLSVTKVLSSTLIEQCDFNDKSNCLCFTYNHLQLVLHCIELVDRDPDLEVPINEKTFYRYSMRRCFDNLIRHFVCDSERIRGISIDANVSCSCHVGVEAAKDFTFC